MVNNGIDMAAESEETLSNKKLIILFVILVLATVGVYLVIVKKSSTEEELGAAREPVPAKTTTTAQKAPAAPEEKSKVAVNESGIFSGTFVRTEGGKIFFRQGEELLELEIKDRIALMCTTQKLEGATIFDFDLVQDVAEVSSADLNTKLNEGEAIILVSEQVGTLKYRVHTVANGSCEALK